MSLRSMRQSRGISQTKLAELTGMTQGRISVLENMKHEAFMHVEIQTALKIMKATGCSLYELVQKDAKEE